MANDEKTKQNCDLEWIGRYNLQVLKVKTCGMWILDFVACTIKYLGALRHKMTSSVANITAAAPFWASQGSLTLRWGCQANYGNSEEVGLITCDMVRC